VRSRGHSAFSTPIEITSRRGDAVLLARADYEALEETAHLLRVPASARRLTEGLQQARTGQRPTLLDMGVIFTRISWA
jgi:PHD/YefM family antitoxin component YafN of YafNO toxin-antitoxin module